jgi:hypothetical protein
MYEIDTFEPKRGIAMEVEAGRCDDGHRNASLRKFGIDPPLGQARA